VQTMIEVYSCDWKVEASTLKAGKWGG
jgi:hypothetical protein